MDFVLLGITMSAPLVVFVMCWITQITSVSISPPRIFHDGLFSEMVTEVEVVQGDGLCDIGDMMNVDNDFSSMMGVLVWGWGYSQVRSKTWVEVTLIVFSRIDCSLVVSGWVFLMVGSVWEWGPTRGIEAIGGLQVKEVIGIELINSEK